MEHVLVQAESFFSLFAETLYGQISPLKATVQHLSAEMKRAEKFQDELHRTLLRIRSQMLDEDTVRGIVKDLIEDSEERILKAIRENRPKPEEAKAATPEKLNLGQLSDSLSVVKFFQELITQQFFFEDICKYLFEMTISAIYLEFYFSFCSKVV